MSDPLERTEAYHMEYYGLTPESLRQEPDIRTKAIQHLLQQIESDPEYPSYPPHCQEDYVWYRLNDLEDDNHLPLDLTAFDIFSSWITKRRPDTTVIHLGEEVSKPFYE